MFNLGERDVPTVNDRRDVAMLRLDAISQRRAGVAKRPRADCRAGRKLAGERRGPGPSRGRHESRERQAAALGCGPAGDVRRSSAAAGQARKSGTHVGLGWDAVRTGSDGPEYHKSGSTAGVRAYMEHVADIDWVLLLNSDGLPDGQSTAVARLVEEYPSGHRRHAAMARRICSPPARRRERSRTPGPARTLPNLAR